MNCTACNIELMKKDVRYTEDRLPYCGNPMTCSEEHPNSPKNIIERLGAVKMFSEEELERNIFETLDVSEEMKERIIKVATKPQSIRLSKMDVAYYVLKLQEAKELASVSEAVRYCIELAMTTQPIGELLEPSSEPIEEPEVFNPEIEELEEVARFVEPEPVEVKKGVKVIPKAKDLIMAQIEEKEEEPEENKFVF